MHSLTTSSPSQPNIGLDTTRERGGEDDIILRMSGVTKSFPGVKALNNAELTLRKGEVHVLFGENGAGKSTLINIVAGVLTPDSGTIELAGAPLVQSNVQHARRNGISAMFQEFSLAPDLTVAENLLLGREPRFGPLLNHRRARAEASAAVRRFGFDLKMDALVAELPRAEQQLVEMSKALLTDPRILILDEPTASLSEKETQVLFRVIRELKAAGVAIIYITHRVREIWEIADRVTVMRDGGYIGTLDTTEATEDRLIEMMTGRRVADLYPQIAHATGRTRLQLKAVSSRDGDIQDINIEVGAGEIVGLAGLVGCGKSDIGRLCFGLKEISGGSVLLDGQELSLLSPKSMLDHGVCYITSDRRGEGLLLERSTQENITLSAIRRNDYSRMGFVHPRQEPAKARSLAEKLRLRPLAMDTPVVNFSGGNQQKIVIGRALAIQADVLIFDEPTVGIDVGARAEIYRVLADMVAEGRSILMISSDLPEIMHLSNRVYVVSEGRIVDHLSKDEISEERILRSFFKDKDNENRG